MRFKGGHLIEPLLCTAGGTHGWLTCAGKPNQTDAEGAAQKLMQLAISGTGGLVNLGTALTSRFQILARFRHQNLEPRKRLHDYFPNLNTKPGPQF